MSRDRIDWDNLTPLPRKKRDGATPDDLAKRRFNMQKAHHKGRCHLSNQKRRQIAKERAANAAKTKALRDGKFRTLKNRIRAFWAGEQDEHP
jgi:hypothetical protein